MHNKKNNKPMNRNPIRWISLVLLLASGSAVASTPGCDNGGQGDDGGTAPAILLVELRGRTSNGADIIVNCEVQYTADIGGDAEFREGVVRKMVQDQSNSTLLRLSLSSLRSDVELLGNELTDDLNALVDQNPDTRDVFSFDITCAEPELDLTTTG